MSKYVFGVDIGGTTIKFGLFTEAGELVEKFVIDTDISDEGTKLLPSTAKAILDKLAEKSLTIADVAGVGVGVPGPVDDDGVVLIGVNINWPKPVAVKKVLSDLLGLPVNVTNDANIAALGEMWLGAAKGARNAIMYTLGTGVGGGIIVDGKVINGTNGAGGEIGHTVAIPDGGAQCGCGKTGCLETVTSATGIVRMTKEKLAESQAPSSLREIADVKAKDVFDAAKAGDELALEIVDRVGYYLGLNVANLTAVTDPEQVIFGGGVAYAGDILLDTVRKHFVKYAFASVHNTPFVVATLGNDAGIIGGAYLATN
ncbi:MAG: ROK family glucokinase [Turicibacter sp.]|nr:ROK family glucokinase [Turicibacter sp.]